MTVDDRAADRRERLARARLYLVCSASPQGGELREVLGAALAGGVEIFQLREKHLPDAQLLAAARVAKEVCERAGALFVLNDRPDLALEVGADGVHVGQHDMPVTDVRELVGPDILVGLSTHAPAEIDAVDAALVDYIGVGPVHATPTKLGRPAVGNELVVYAVGGLDADNVDETLAAGATRVCVLRAIADAPEPEAAAHALNELLRSGAPTR
jgi:thiamine-phosphate pyrophosphorylase